MFSKATIQFLDGISKHNDKAWFDAHRADYDAHVAAPARELVSALGARLNMNGSIMRINRDIRFSKDKSPYKTHLDMFFREGDDKGWDKPGYFFRLRPKALLLGTGMHHFEKDVLERYRKAEASTISALAKEVNISCTDTNLIIQKTIRELSGPHS